MKHAICHGCNQTLPEMGVCENESCPDQWEMMTECDCTDGFHGKKEKEEEMVVKDSNGNLLQDGDSVMLIKDLTLRGTSQKIKQGTKVSKIRLTDNPDEIDGKVDGMAIVLRTEFLKRV
ncbi:MAG: zinc ribbon domain-containing protein YjdM [bacterium]|nr:zinc ribbon domain-containing protein YjdM [bacterium]